MELTFFINKFAEALEIEDVSALNGRTEFRNLEEWDSLAVLSLVAMFDEEFGKEVNAKNLRPCNTIADLYEIAIK